MDAVLAEQGYAVIQPNYRGSSGYGVAFQARPRRMGPQDARRPARRDGLGGKQGIADVNRVCIVGASYGGYAAMRGAQREAAHYRCAISYAGVSDLSAMKRYDTQFLLGNMPSVLAEAGPGLHRRVAAIPGGAVRRPILIAHGVEDKRVPVKQSRLLVDALRKAGKTDQYLEQNDGDHHFSRAEDRLEFLKATKAFLDKFNPS